MSKWSEDECIVLVTLFLLSDFKEGDDSNQLNHQMSKYFKKSIGSIDMQWRNIKAILNDESNRTVATNIRKWTLFGITNFNKIKQMSQKICNKKKWDFEKLSS